MTPPLTLKFEGWDFIYSVGERNFLKVMHYNIAFVTFFMESNVLRYFSLPGLDLIVRFF